MTLTIAMLLDAILGEPRWLWDRIPHPAVLIGQIIGWCDKRFNTGTGRRLKGTVTFAALCSGAILLGLLLAAIPGQIIDVLVCAILLAQRSLVQHVQAVGNALRTSLGDGRRSVAMIVGRDTATMTKPQVARSAIESAAENLSDGVIAPAFWFVIGGLPGLLLYKVTNTADSMIGYRTPQHKDFGWAAARFDDLLNLIPARATALLIWATAPHMMNASQLRRDAGQHRSPNAGWPEAAMARTLNIALSGPRRYHGTLTDDPFVNPTGNHDIGPDDIDRAVSRLWQTWAIALGIATLTGLF